MKRLTLYTPPSSAIPNVFTFMGDMSSQCPHNLCRIWGILNPHSSPSFLCSASGTYRRLLCGCSDPSKKRCRGKKARISNSRTAALAIWALDGSEPKEVGTTETRGWGRVYSTVCNPLKKSCGLLAINLQAVLSKETELWELCPKKQTEGKRLVSSISYGLSAAYLSLHYWQYNTLFCTGSLCKENSEQHSTEYSGYCLGTIHISKCFLEQPIST